jgi:hypothetical protein
MNNLYALVNPINNKIIQFSQLENLNFKYIHIEYVNDERVVTETTALCIPVVFTPDLINKTYNPGTGTFN